MVTSKKIRHPGALERLKVYLERDFDGIDGWCVPHLWGTVAACHAFQSDNNITGPAAEIGVYHGKFFIGLALLNESERPHFAIDVFDMQEFNLDGAGDGNCEKFIKNCNRSGLSSDNYRAYHTDSMSLKRSEIDTIFSETDGFRMFSIDGCHMPEHTINDIRIAMDLTRPGGIIFVDDYYNPNWPGVQEGVSVLYIANRLNFIPLLFTSNKLFLCHISYHKQYLNYVTEYINEKYKEFRVKSVKRFGYDTITITPDFKRDFAIR